MSGIRKYTNRLKTKLSLPGKFFLIKNKFIPVGCIKLSGDKSIAHRALILSSLSDGNTILHNFPVHDDSLATLKSLETLGVKFLCKKKGVVLVKGCGQQGLKCPQKSIFVNNSGTTLRLLLGVLAGIEFKTKLLAGKYLSLRPMSRVNIPLRLMGAQIKSKIKNNEEYAPIEISGGNLKGITYNLKIASAQVKSAILLAGLFAKGKTYVFERLSSRDHTERMLMLFGANIIVKNKKITLDPRRKLVSPREIYIPGDISSAAFFIVLALIIPKAKIIIKSSSLNSSRSGIIDVLKKMQAKIKINVSKVDRSSIFEPRGDLIIKSSQLKGVVVHSYQVPFLVDELPILMVAACFARGRTIIKGVSELRVKETDRINSMVINLKKMGANIRVIKTKGLENIIILGKGGLCGAELNSFGDHRTAMSMVVASLAAEGESRLNDISCVSKSFPDFLVTLNSLSKKQ